MFNRSHRAALRTPWHKLVVANEKTHHTLSMLNFAFAIGLFMGSTVALLSCKLWYTVVKHELRYPIMKSNPLDAENDFYAAVDRMIMENTNNDD